MQRIESEKKFLRQSYEDARKDYEFLLSNTKAAGWDWVAVTASNERQAAAYQIQIDQRIQNGRLPGKTRFLIVPDLEGKRIGSGGATLNVLRVITAETGLQKLEQQKILIIHSGGDSRRIPQYSACGKLFSPIPRELPGGGHSTLFDELLMSVSRIPSRIAAGMLILPGDTELLFSPLQLDLLSCDAAGLSMKTNIAEGREHGVFAGGKDGLVKRFLHKQPEEILRETGAVDGRDRVDLDTGCIWFGSRLVGRLAELFYPGGQYDAPLFEQFVNDRVRLSFYADFVTPLAADTTWEEYEREKPEGAFSEELMECRRRLWEILHPYSMKLIRMTPAAYLHIGRTDELFRFMVQRISDFEYLGWKRRIQCSTENPSDYAGVNSFVGRNAQLSDQCYLEDCLIEGSSSVGSHSILSGVQIKDMRIPEHVVLHTLKLENGSYVCRIYGIEDNPKGSADSELLGKTLRGLLRLTGADKNQIWDSVPLSIWNARLYAEASGPMEAVQAALVLYRIFQGQAGQEEIAAWLNSRRHSLESSFCEAQASEIISVQEQIRNRVMAENCLQKIRERKDVYEVFADITQDRPEVLRYIRMTADRENDIFFQMRLYLGLSQVCSRHDCQIEETGPEEYEDKAYGMVKEGIVSEVSGRYGKDKKSRFLQEKSVSRLPVRVNFCGSPSDAAPYCLEHGGTMLDAALLLKGKLPIEATVERLEEPVIRFTSQDLSETRVCTGIEEIQDCGNPYDTFALHKAVLVAAGLIPLSEDGESLEELCRSWGGGLALTTSVDVPKGSGLGTSSILAAAAIRALHEIMGEEADCDRIYAEVFAAEQLMNTGGGWQDQAGGLTPGIKYMYTKPGMYQDIRIDVLDLDEEVKKELQERFALIFSGQRRLARNVLRQEMNQCIRNNQEALGIVGKIRKLCTLMRFELERGNITGFGTCVTEQFELVKKLDEGASNTCIEYIFDCCDDLIDGKSICGAGGGGFLQVILKKGVSRRMLEERISQTFQDCGVEVWDSALLYNGEKQDDK